MDPIARMVTAGAAGVSGSSATYVDDVFSTFLYEASGTTQAINNGIDLSGEGGMVWIKNRSNGSSYKNHAIVDSERGANSYGYRSIYSNLTEVQYDPTSSSNAVVTTFNSDGFTRGGNLNVSSGENVSWTFRKQPGFFDVVTWNGNGSVQNISHSLGSTPGMIIVKSTTTTQNWTCYHRSLGSGYYIDLNGNDQALTSSNMWGGTSPTSTHFSVGAQPRVNGTGHSYVAYIFAHDDQSFGTDSDEAIIKCGSYTGSGSDGNFVNVGFEPQFLLIKNASVGNTNWMLFDVMRGLPNGSGAIRIFANDSQAEGTNNSVDPSSTGFTPAGSGSYTNQSSDTYIYMAIRRPHKPPAAATEVFEPVSRTSQDPNLFSTALNHVDAVWSKLRGSNTNWLASNRLTAPKYMHLNSTVNESTGTLIHYDYNYKIDPSSMASGNSQINYLFKRAPGFFDVVTYTGNNLNRTISHNLGVAPELIFVKGRSFNDSWAVYNKISGATITNTFTSSSSFYASSTRWNDTEPTSTVFSLGSDNSVNKNSQTHIAYLFASLDGISKVGSYTGTGNNVNVDCGFTAGARFVMVKRMDNNGEWYVWDTARGIVSGNDPYLSFSTGYGDDTSTDYIDPLNAGFTITSSATSNFNASGVNYLFLAIA